MAPVLVPAFLPVLNSPPVSSAAQKLVHSLYLLAVSQIPDYQMKKLLFFLLSVVLIGSVGCGSNKDLSTEVTDTGSTEVVNENTLNTRLSRSRKIFATSNTSLSIPNTIFNVHFNMISNTFPIPLNAAIGEYINDASRASLTKSGKNEKENLEGYVTRQELSEAKLQIKADVMKEVAQLFGNAFAIVSKPLAFAFTSST